MCCSYVCFFCFSSRRRHTRCALVTGVQTCALPISSGAPVFPYIKPFGAHLFLSANPESVRTALENGVGAATILPSKAAGFASEQIGRASCRERVCPYV